MRAPLRATRDALEINITPLVDVVFLLIIFFLVASYFVNHGELDSVALPLATGGEWESVNEARFVVTVRPDGTLLIDGETVQQGLFEQRLSMWTTRFEPQKIELRIRGDGAAGFGSIEPVLATAAKLGITRIRFAVMPAGRSS